MYVSKVYIKEIVEFRSKTFEMDITGSVNSFDQVVDFVQGHCQLQNLLG